MNPEVIALIAAYKAGQLPVDRFLSSMQQFGYGTEAATKALIDYEVQQTQARRQQEGGTSATPAPSAAPSATPTPTPAPREVPLTMAGPAPGIDDPNALTPAMRGPLLEDRATRARLSDLPSDFGSPTGSMAYPSQLPSNLQPAAVRQAVSVARSIPQREVSNTQTTEGPSALASFIRGRFGDAAQGSPFNDRLTAFQEARDRMGDSRASGGSVDAKPPKDAALHKALEIIHYMLAKR